MQNTNTGSEPRVFDELTPRYFGGMPALLINIAAMLAAIFVFVLGVRSAAPFKVIEIVAALLYILIVGPIVFGGLKVLKPNEALVLTLFGKYIGTLKGAGFYWVNPFATALRPGKVPITKISLKAMTLNNEQQKINDLLGNPIVIGIVVIWKVVNTAMAVLNVDNYYEFLSIQCDSALRNIVRMYPYDVAGDDDEKTLRSSSQEIAEKLKMEIQEKTAMAGLEIVEARITHLAYAPEIASAMLQRQQASAIVDARQMIVEGAVSMVEMALEKLSERDIVQLDDERKAAMVSNLLVVLCGNKDAQPIVNSGSLY
ncbi:MAG: SPFH domain-containing protein [Oscillospiraceae bacterium]|jgi:regulator of protease activity HflC (stomatin/prohibitin superfamily)|nr:SPFH domain-containing protein [Oscillospiraceae bacterium]